MELGILAGVALLGYGLSNAGKTSAPDDAVSPFPDDAAANNQISADEDRLYDANFQASMDPEQTGIVPPNMGPAFDRRNRQLTAHQLQAPWAAQGRNCNPTGPYYRSEKNMATSDAWKQDRMELFTGELDACRSRTGTYRAKREAGPMFNPAQSAAPVSFSGRQAYVDLRGAQDEEQFQLGQKYEGVGPVDPVRVGPGLGLDPSVPAAGGYQQFFRIMPENANSYRKTNLPGRVVPGMVPVPAGAAVGQATQTGQGKVVWDAARQPLQESRAAVTGHAQYGCFRTREQPEPVHPYAGHAVRPGGVLSGVDATNRVREDGRFCGFVLNAAGERAGQGGYANPSAGDPGAFRQALNALPIGAPRGWNQGGFAAAGVQARPTQREQGGAAPNVGGMAGATTVRGQEVRPTQRDTCHMAQGQAYGGVRGVGPVFDAGVNPDKPDFTVGYTPGAAAPNQWAPCQPTARLRQPPNAARVNEGSMTSVQYGRPGEVVSCMNKLPSAANLDLGLASRVLNTNPLTHPLYR